MKRILASNRKAKEVTKYLFSTSVQTTPKGKLKKHSPEQQNERDNIKTKKQIKREIFKKSKQVQNH